jgi:DNA-directed RNA polymerase alpha subunit
MISRESYLKALEVVKEYRNQCNEDLKDIKDVFNSDELRNKLLVDVGLSVRCLNILHANHERLGIENLNWGKARVVDLGNVSEIELRKCRNMGKRSLDELKELCQKAKIILRP